MANPVHHYRASLIWTGNRGQGTSSTAGYDRSHVARIEGKPDLALTADPAYRGDPKYHNPEELLLLALASCHMLSYLYLCAAHKIIVRAYEDQPSGRMAVPASGKGHFEEVVLHPRVILESGDAGEALRLHHGAHEACFIANSVNFPVRFEPVIESAANGP